jgi:hypothetical protein
LIKSAALAATWEAPASHFCQSMVLAR